MEGPEGRLGTIPMRAGILGGILGLSGFDALSASSSPVDGAAGVSGAVSDVAEL
jgi:hypothetical protein